MALHLTLAEHEADPPANWRIRKCGRCWSLVSALHDNAIEHFDTKREAEAAKTSGRLIQLYNDEGRWFRGERVRNWKPYQKAA